MSGYRWEWPSRVSADADSLDAFMHDGTMVPGALSVHDLLATIEWLATYQTDDPTDPASVALVNVIGLLDRQVHAKRRRAAVTQAKREYSKRTGIPVSQVRVSR